MNRKNTILIAVLINAGLLSVLLIAALTTQEEPLPSSDLIGESAVSHAKNEERPLFGDSMDLGLRKSGDLRVESPIAIPLPEMVKPMESAPLLNAQLQIPAGSPAAPAPQEQIVHKLPTLETESNPSLAAASTGVPNAASPAAASRSQAAPFIEVAVKKGDNLEKIAKHNRTTVDEIIKLNQLPSSFLRVGQVLKIPSERNLAAAPSAPSTKAKAASESASPEYYTVKVGDNPWTIAMKHHIKVEELLRLNGLNEEKARKLKPGDRLRTR